MYRFRFEYSADLGLYWFVEVTCPENLIFWMGFVSYENLHWEFCGCHFRGSTMTAMNKLLMEEPDISGP